MFNSNFVQVFLILLAFSHQASINPSLIKSSSQVQMGTFDIGDDTMNVYNAAGYSPVSKLYTINLVKGRSNGFCYGLAIRNLEWDFSYNCIGYIHLSMNTATQSSFSFNVGSYFGFFIMRLKFSYIVIDSSITKFLYIQMLSIPLPANPSISSNSYNNITLPITFPGSNRYAVTRTLLYAVNYQFRMFCCAQKAGVYLQVTGLNQAQVNVSAYFPYQFRQLSTIKFFILYFIPDQFGNIYNIFNNDIISTGASSGPILSYTSQTIHTNIHLCTLSDQNTFIGLESFSKSDRIKFELEMDQVFVNITAFYQGFRFSIFSICSLACYNPSYPYFLIYDFQCYDVCPPKIPTSTIDNCYFMCPQGYYLDPANICLACANFCISCQSPTSCFQCQKRSFLYLGLCLLICPSTTYGNTSLNKCLSCTGTCFECSMSAQNCTTCIVNTFYMNNQCYYICPAGLYGNIGTSLCQICATNCLKCSSLTECYQCQDGSFLYYGLCLLICPNTTYGNTSLNECLNCTGTCLNCQNSAKNCTSCINNTFLLNNICYYTCPVGYYGNSTTGTCQHCFLNCYTCIASNICTQCLLSNYLYPNFDRCFTQCPPNYFPNKTTKACQKIYIQGCVSALYQNNKSVCLQCTISSHFRFDTSTRNCVCQSGYKLIGGVCVQTCGDGTLVNLQQCDDGNLINGDGCNTQCKTQNDFSCEAVPNGPTLTSQCAYLSQMNIQILSQTKIDGQNSLRLILGINPAPPLLTADQIKRFLNIEIGNKTLNISNYILTYENGVASIQIPYTQTIEGKQINIWTSFDSSKFGSSNIQFSSILEGDNAALIYSNNWKLYQNLAIFNFPFAILVCIIGVISFYKHKMIGLELILPIQAIFYSQSFYKTKAVSDSLYTAFKSISFSVLTPKEVESKTNEWYKIGMTGGFLQNYNFLGVLFAISTIFLILNMFKMQHGQRNRFKNKKRMKQWVNFGQFRKLIQDYQTVIWKGFFVFFCLSTIPLIFAILSVAMTQSKNYGPFSNLDIIGKKLCYIFTLLFLFALFYTSVPKIFYFNDKNFLKKHIVKQDCQKYKYDAKYCMYFELHYLAIGIIFACLKPTLTVLYTLSSINGIFFLYMLIKRPYESIIDNIGAILSISICSFYISMNLYYNILTSQNSQQQSIIKALPSFIIIILLVIQTLIALIRYYTFYRIEKIQQSNSKKTKYQRTFKYVRDQAFNRFNKPITQEQEQQEINKMMNQIKPVFNKQLSININNGIQLNNNSKNQRRFQKRQPNIFQNQNKKQQKIQIQAEGQYQYQNQNQNQKQKQMMKKSLRKNLLKNRINQNK